MVPVFEQAKNFLFDLEYLLLQVFLIVFLVVHLARALFPRRSEQGRQVKLSVTRKRQ